MLEKPPVIPIGITITAIYAFDKEEYVTGIVEGYTSQSIVIRVTETNWKNIPSGFLMNIPFSFIMFEQELKKKEEKLNNLEIKIGYTEIPCKVHMVSANHIPVKLDLTEFHKTEEFKSFCREEGKSIPSSPIYYIVEYNKEGIKNPNYKGPLTVENTKDPSMCIQWEYVEIDHFCGKGNRQIIIKDYN